MPVHPDEPLTKVTLNLYTADVEELAVHYGHGWSTIVRGLVRTHLLAKTRPITVGDLDELNRSKRGTRYSG